MIAVLALVAGACSRPPAPPDPLPPAGDPPGLHNFRSVGDGLWSGSSPEGDDGFRSLHELGILTILTVDGSAPDVERARRFGLRYVHLPIGYGGITREQAVQLAKAAAELPGPVYVHCHHGQHRGPAAAAIMGRCRTGGFSADEAIAFLHAAGTDPRYEGLYAAVREFRPPTADELRAAPATLPEVADIGGLTARMVEIDEIWDGLKRAKANGWRATGASESVAHGALRLREAFREAARLPDVAHRSASFHSLLTDAERAAEDLETGLRAGDAAATAEAFDRSAGTCAACHKEFRDRAR
jgi:hypothetical protein